MIHNTSIIDKNAKIDLDEIDELEQKWLNGQIELSELTSFLK